MKNKLYGVNGEIRNNVSFEDFKKVFKVFESYPFNESWSEEELCEEYEKFTAEGSALFGYYIDEKCVAILTLYPRVPGEHPVKYEEGKKVMYLSDVATLRDYRRMGIGTKLFVHALRHTEVLGYDYIYLRTNFDETDSMSARIARNCGFERIWEVCQEVERKRSDGVVRKDLRMFMEKKLR